LGCNQVNDRDSQVPEFSRYTKIEVRAVGQDRELGLFDSRRLDEFPELFVNTWDVMHYLDQPHDGETARIDNLSHPVGAHVRTGATEKVYVRVSASDCGNKLGRIKIPGSFPSRYENLRTHRNKFINA
jgi:hypothetical protein